MTFLLTNMITLINSIFWIVVHINEKPCFALTFTDLHSRSWNRKIWIDDLSPSAHIDSRCAFHDWCLTGAQIANQNFRINLRNNFGIRKNQKTPDFYFLLKLIKALFYEINISLNELGFNLTRQHWVSINSVHKFKISLI